MRALTNGSEQVQVNTQNSGFQHQSDISVGADGAPVVVWKVYPGVQGKDVMARVFDSTGAGSDSFLVNQTTRHKQWMPSIDHLEDGSFAVAWWGRGDGDTYGTFLRTFNADGSAISDEARQNFTTKGVQSRPAVAAANSGYVVLWQGKGEGDNTGIFARFFETEIGEPFSIAAIDNVSIDEGDLFTIDADIVDLDGVADSPTFSLGDSAPTGMTIDPVTGEITWQTDELDGPGTYEVVGNATTGTEGDDDFFTTSETFMIDVAEVDTAPVLAVVPDREINSEETSEFSVSATDVDIPVNDLTYTATLSNGDPLPGFLVFNPTTQTFTANPVDADEGVYEITVTVTDSTALSDSDTFTLTVNGNDAPVLNAAIPNQTATEDQAFSFDVSSFFSDPDNDTLTYSFTTSDGEPLPSWLSFNAATGTFSGTPTNRDIQDVTVTVTATDPGNLSASDTFTINVVDVNGFAPDIVDEVFVIPTTAANGSAVGTVSAGDADPTSTLTYSIVSGNGNGNYTIDSATGAITVADNTNLGTTNPDVIGVQVSDGMSTDTAEITIFITDSAGSAGYTLSAVDSNGDPLMTIEPGQTFELILSTEDLTATPTGVFSAFADIVYQTEMVSVNGDVVHSDTYPSGTNADLLAGLIDEAGGVDGITDLGAGVFEVLRVPMIAADNLADGTPITFGTNPTENLVTHPTLLFGDTDNVAPSEIRYGTLDLVVDTGVNSGGGGQGTAPDLVDYFFQVDTASSNGANVGTIVGSDADGDALSYSIFSGNANGTFAINSATGQITVANSTNLASATPAVLTVSASDGSNTTMSEVQILATTSSIEASYTLSAEDTNGNEITSVAPGQTIDLIMSVQDTRVAPTGIFSAFADIGYHASSVSIAGNVTHSLTYGSGTNAVLDGAGLIDEAGGVDGITPLGGAVIEVLRVPMVVAASANGQIAFATNPTEDGIAHPTLLFGASANLENEFINYGSLVLDVATVSTATSSFNFDIDSVTEDDSTGDYDVLDAVFGDL